MLIVHLAAYFGFTQFTCTGLCTLYATKISISLTQEMTCKMLYSFSDWFRDTKSDAAGSKDWVFLNYTFKRFEGLTQRGVKVPLLWTASCKTYFPAYVIFFIYLGVNLKMILMKNICQQIFYFISLHKTWGLNENHKSSFRCQERKCNSSFLQITSVIVINLHISYTFMRQSTNTNAGCSS